MQTDSSKQQAEVKSGVRSGGMATSGLLEWRRRRNNRRGSVGMHLSGVGVAGVDGSLMESGVCGDEDLESGGCGGYLGGWMDRISRWDGLKAC